MAQRAMSRSSVKCLLLTDPILCNLHAPPRGGSSTLYKLLVATKISGSPVRSGGEWAKRC